MLEPDDRRLLLESLRPPLGYRLDQAVGTTFTLDLLALLAAPMAFTLFDAEAEDGRPTADPVALLRAVREYGDQITIFCQGGQIAVPPHDQLLYANLEDSIYQVARAGSLFHPKVWLLRYTAEPGPVKYRFLCLSRNLTFDRSWDTVLRLDGELTKRKRTFRVNHPLADFIAALPALTLSPKLPVARAECLRQLADEFRRVEFELPEGFREIRFWPLGIPGHKSWPFTGDIRRMLIVSPFIGSDALRKIGSGGKGHVLVSRGESLDNLPDRSVLNGLDVRVMDDAAALEATEAEDAAETNGSGREAPDETLRGLHAKVYAADRGTSASVWLGSANATQAGLGGGNVEMLVELAGTYWHCGVDSILNGRVQGGDSFGALLRPYDVEAEPTLRDPDLERLEGDVEQLQLALARERFLLSVEGPDDDANYTAELVSKSRDGPRTPSGMKLSAWPITRNPAEAKSAVRASKDQVVARFEGLVATTLTPFVAFEIEAQRGSARHAVRFVLKVPMRGAPRGRHEDVLRSLLSDKRRILRYLLLILAETEGAAVLAPEVIAALTRGENESNGARAGAGIPLLEGLLRALERDDEKLEQIARLLADLGEDGESQAVLPDGFREVWEPIWSARRIGRR